VIANHHVTTQGRAIGENRVVADDAVMRNVHISHQPVVIADSGQTLLLCRAPVDRTEFANGVVIAYFQPRCLAAILLVLWNLTDGCELVDPVVAADPRFALDHRMRPNRRARANLDIAIDNRVRTHLDIVRKARR